MHQQSSLNKMKISIIEDCEILSEWLKIELENDPIFEVISQDRLGRLGITSAKEKKPDVVLLDFQLEDLTGLEVAKRINLFNERIKLFIITAHTDFTILERIINDKSVKGLAIKSSIYFDINLLSAIKNVAVGGVYLEPSLLEKLRESNKPNGISNLTPREFEVFIQSYSGKSDIKIASDLHVELPYIKNIKSKISKKIKNTNVNNLLSKLIENANPNQVLIKTNL